MTKSGSRKSNRLSGTDISLIIIALFLLFVVICVGFACCRRKQSTRKKKPAQRQFGKQRRHPEHDPIIATGSQHSEESFDLEAEDLGKGVHKSFEDSPKNNKTDSPPCSPKNTRGLLSWIMSSVRNSTKCTGDTDPESSQNKESKGANTSKADSSTSQKGNSKKDNTNAGKKKELEEIKANESVKPKSKGRDSSQPKSNPSFKKCSRTSTDTDPLTNSSTESALLCGIGSTTKPTQNNRYDKKHTKCNGQNSCKKCSAHIDNDGGNDSMKSMETGTTKAGKNGKGKGRKNQENSSGDCANRSDYGSMETGAPITDRDRRGQRRRDVGDFSGEFDNRSDHDSKKTDGPSTDRDKRGKGRPKPEDSSGEFVNQKSKMAKGADSSKLTKGKNYGKTPTQGIRSSLDDGHGSFEMDHYDMCKDFEQDIQKMEVTETCADPPVKRMEFKETCANPPDNDVSMAKEEGREVKGRDDKAKQDPWYDVPAARNKTAIEPETRIESIGEIYNVIQYAAKEWKSDTATAQAVRAGYYEIPSLLGLNNLRVIRGDNYCAIRATLFQVLAQRIPILSQLKNIETIPRVLMGAGFDWIDEWSFASRLPVGREKVCEEMAECLKELSNLVNLNAQMHQEEGRITHLLSHFNFKPIEYEIRLLEAVKFLMLFRAIKLYQKIKCEEDVPVFAMIMFARDSSQDPHQFMMKHLNAVGDTGGLEQVEMHLLGYTLGIMIKVVRPSHVGQPDFIASYPEDMPSGTPVITLVAEDDRHYNILS